MTPVSLPLVESRHSLAPINKHLLALNVLVFAQVRIEQVLASAPALLLCFRLAQLLGFYAETVAQLAGPGAALVAALQAAQVLSLIHIARSHCGESTCGQS